jgi:phosphoribosylformylglycinamidine synthase
MLKLLGNPALTDFQKDKLLAALQKIDANITDLSANKCYFLDSASLSNSEMQKLLQILSLDSADADFNPDLIVLPRLGTASSWSSKATEIFHNCGLASIKRIEQGIAYFFEGQVNDKKELSVNLHDRMTENVYFSINEVPNLFQQIKPETFKSINILQQGKSALIAVNTALGLALSEEEIDYLYQRFSALKRNPSDVELMMFAQANSEHCRHKIFNASWIIDGVAKEKSLFNMIKNTYQNYHENILSAYSDNAAVLAGWQVDRFYPDNQQNYNYHSEQTDIMIKVETHNHPTAISPFPGAATGAGGEIRDEGATGRGGKPKVGLCGFSVSNLNIPDWQRPWEIVYGKPDRIVSALAIMLEGPIGAAAFNNEFGRPTICGYFRTYEQNVDGTVRGYHKPIMLSGGFGNINREHVEKHAIPAGSQIIVLGGPAMLIGIGGGAASSMASGVSHVELDFASVQRDNPEMERRCQEVIDRCWQRGKENPIISIHDVGAGGLSNALPELIHDADKGAHFHLREIPLADAGMAPVEIWCNEAQERYVLAIASNNVALFTDIARRERCPFAIVGEATEQQTLLLSDRLFNNKPIDLPMDVLFGSAPKMLRDVKSSSVTTDPINTQNIDLSIAIERVLQLPAVADKKFLITIGDRSVGGLVARDQCVGPWQVAVSDVAVTTTSFIGYHGEAMAMGERTPLAIINAAAAARMAVAETITNLAAARIEKLSDIKLSANWMAAAGVDGEDAKLYEAVEAIGEQLCPALDLTIPVGKDSMSMRTEWEDKRVVSPLSLIVSGFAPVLDVRKTLTPELCTKHQDSVLLLIDLGEGKNRLAFSALAQVFNLTGKEVPDLNRPELLAAFFSSIQTLNAQEKLLAYHDRSDGGLLASICEMMFASNVGIDLNISELGNDVITSLFNEELGAVIQVAQHDIPMVEKLLSEQNLTSHRIATLNANKTLRIIYQEKTIFSASKIDLHQTWSETSYRMQSLRDNPHCAAQEFSALREENQGLFVNLNGKVTPKFSINKSQNQHKPRVAILREQGVNGQLEMAAAFTRAGFVAVDVHMSDILSGKINLRNFQVLAACGGFSYGDVLGAGSGWATSILFEPKIRQQFTDFFQREDTLSLGICNGCQMLSQLKDIIPGAEHWPRFVRNDSAQFEARFLMVEVMDSPSVFLRDMQHWQLPIVVSHGEGKVKFANAADSQQNVALRYLDNHGEITEAYPFNPNGSIEGITGLTTKDGRVTIMMPHPERVFRTVQCSWHPNEWQEDSPWMQMFYNARQFFK